MHAWSEIERVLNTSVLTRTQSKNFGEAPLKKGDLTKRKTELSALIRSNQIERDTALHITTNTKYEFDKTLIKFVRKKFDLSEDEWLNIYNLPVKSFLDYPSYYPLMKKLRFFIKLATKMNLLPKLLYLKYLYEK